MTTTTAILVLVIGANAPLGLPGDFDPAVIMPGRTTETGVYHESRAAAGMARRLVANGTAEDLARAEKVLDAVLACQETRPGQRRYGNFRWMLEDRRVTDVNAVEFVFSSLIPMMLHHQDRLSPEMRERVLVSIRLGLEDIAKMDVTLSYSNMTVYDIVNTCLGGELLDDETIAQRGYAKLRAWEVFTCANGAPFEFNSPTYTAISLDALKRLADMVEDQNTRIRARTMAARMGLGVGLRIHRGTGRWAGPHSRAYQPTVEGRGGPEVRRVHGWIANGTIPSWVSQVLDNPPLPMQVTETASTRLGIDLTTYQSPSFAMGVSSRGYVWFGRQSNQFMVHYTRPGADRPGVVYSRYLTNDKWLGDWYHRTDRTSSRNLLDEGRFYGVQSGPRAIGVYTTGNVRSCTSAKGTLIWTQRQHVDEIWVGDRRIDQLPADIKNGEIVVVGSGDALVAVLPLARTDLGGGAPARLVERDGSLVLEMYNYLGPEMTLRRARNRHRCGFLAEAAERADYPDGNTFGQVVAGGTLTDRVHERNEMPWTVEYARDGERLGLEVNLARWKLERRWDHRGDLGWPMLESPVARQNSTGRVVVGDAVLECAQNPGWLFADPKSNTWVAGYHGTPAPLTLTVPNGTVHVEAMATGTVAWENGTVHVEAVGLLGKPTVTGGTLAQ